nr:polyprotein [Alphaendornavirus sp.]
MDQQAPQNNNNTHTHNRGSKEESTVGKWCNPFSTLTKQDGEDCTAVANRGMSYITPTVGNKYNLNGKLVSYDKLAREAEKNTNWNLRKVKNYPNVQGLYFSNITATRLINRVWRQAALRLHPDVRCYHPFVRISMEDQFDIYRNWSDRERVAQIISNQSDEAMLLLGLNPGLQTDIKSACCKLAQSRAVKPHVHNFRQTYLSSGQGTVRAEVCEECKFNRSLRKTEGNVCRLINRELTRRQATLKEIRKLQNKIYPPIKETRAKERQHRSKKQAADGGHSVAKRTIMRVKVPKKARVARFKRLLRMFDHPTRCMLKGELTKSAKARLEAVTQGKPDKTKRTKKKAKQQYASVSKNMDVNIEALNLKYAALTKMIEEEKAVAAKLEEERLAELERKRKIREEKAAAKAAKLQAEADAKAKAASQSGEDTELVETDEPIVVGGDRDCWKSILSVDLPGDYPSKSVTEFIEMVDMIMMVECDFDFDKIPTAEHMQVALNMQDFGTHLHILGGSISRSKCRCSKWSPCKCRATPWYEVCKVMFSGCDSRMSTAAFSDLDTSAKPELMSYKMFKDKYASRKKAVRVPKVTATAAPEDSTSDAEAPTQLIPVGNCWDCISQINIDVKDHLKYFQAQNRKQLGISDETDLDCGVERMWATTKAGEIDIQEGPMAISTFIEILEWAVENPVEESEVAPTQEYCLKRDGQMLHLLRIGYNNYSDLKAEFGEGAGLVNDDGKSSSEGLERLTMKELIDKLRELMAETDDDDEEELQVGAIGTLNKLTSINHALGAPVMPDTSKWEQLVDNHDLRAAALAIAKVDHQAYGLPGVKPETALEELTNPEKGGWALGMNMTFTNKGSPAEAELAIPEATATHMARQLMHGQKTAVYNCPEWLDISQYLDANVQGKCAIVFGTRDAITTANMGPMLKKKSACTIVLPHYNKEMPTFITSDSGDDVFQRDTDNLHVVNGCMTKVISHDINLVHGLNTKELATLGGGLWKITTMGIVGMYKVIHLSRMQATQQAFSHMVSINYNTVVRKWSVFMPTTDTILGSYVPSFQMREVSIDAELFRTMCAHNLHRGDLGFTAMMSRAIGYAHRRYHSKHGAVQRIDISHERLVDHAFIASICVRRAYIQRRWLMNMDAEPAWVKAALKYGVTAGEMALQALYEGSGTFREMSDWIRHIQKVSTINLHDYTNQNIFTEIEAWSMESDVKGWQCHVAGQVYKTPSCGHHTDACQHTGNNICRCCTEPTDGNTCSCCQAASCQASHTCDHKCDGIHEGSGRCDCCGKPSDDIKCSGCTNPYSEYDEDVEWDNFREKIESVGGSIPGKAKPKPRGSEAGKPATTQPMPPGTEYRTKDNTLAVVPLEDAVDLGSGKHLHKCADCKNYYTHIHNFTSVKHPLFRGDCPWCEGNLKSVKTDDTGKPLLPETGAPATESQVKTIIDDKNRMALLEQGYSIEEVEALAGDCNAYAKIMGEPTENTATMPMIPAGITFMACQNSEFNAFGEIPDDENCALNTFRTWVSKAKTTDFIAVTGRENNHTTEDMCRMAEYYKTNILLISPDEIVFGKYQDRDVFNTVIADTPGHWRPGNAKITPTELSELTKTGASVTTIRQIASKISKRVADPKTVSLLTELEVVGDIVKSNTMVKMVVEGDMICNNRLRVHNPKNNNYCFKMPPNFPNLARKLIEHPTMETYNEAITTKWVHEVKTNVKDELKYRIINAAISIAETHLLDKLKQGQYEDYKITLATRTNYESVLVPLPKGKWRPNDMVYMVSPEHSGWHAINPMTTVDAVGTVSVVAPMRLPMGGSHYRMRVAKGAYSSAIKTLHCYCKLSEKLLDEAVPIIESECVIGVPGSGKSKAIVDHAKPSDLIVTFTNGNLTNMRIKLGEKFKADNPMKTQMVVGKNTPRIMDILTALETSALEHPKLVDNIFIDECTMAGLLEYKALKLLLREPENPDCIKLFGDDSQIGQVTITKMRQEGKTTELQNFVSPEKIKHWDESWRMGVEMCDVASYVTGRRITSMTKKPNKIMVYNLTDPAEQIRAIQRVKPNIVIICFTSATLRYLENKMIKGAVYKVHGYQGQEAADTIIIQEKATAVNTIPADPRYCYSAFTRSKGDIHWISMGNQAGSIKDRIGKIGTLQGFVGNTFISKLKEYMHVKKRKTTVEHDDPEVIQYLSNFKNQGGAGHLPTLTKTKIAEYAKTKHHVNVMFQDNADGSTTLQLYKGSMLGVELNYKNKKITVIKDKFNAMNDSHIKSMEEALESNLATVEPPVWTDCTQLSSHEQMVFELLLSCVQNAMVVGLNTRIHILGEDWTLKGDAYDWSSFTIQREELELRVKHTGEDDIVVCDGDHATLHELLNWVWETKSKTLGVKMNATLSRAALMTMASLKAGKASLRRAVSVMLGLEFNEEAENYRVYESKFNKFNARNLLAYTMLTPSRIADSVIIVGAKNREGQLGWIINNKFYDLGQRESVEALLLFRSMDGIRESWVYKLAELIHKGMNQVRALAMGANLKPWGDHAAEDTHAAQYVSNKIAQLKSRLLKFEQKPITLTPSANKEWTTLIELTMSSCGYNWTSHPNVLDSNSAAMEQVALRMLHKLDDIKLYSMNADATILSGLYKGIVLQPQSAAARAMYDVSIPTLLAACDRIMESNVDKLTDGPVKENLVGLMEAAVQQKSGIDVWTGRYNNKIRHDNLVVNAGALDYTSTDSLNHELFDMVTTNKKLLLITAKVDLHGTPHNKESVDKNGMHQIINTTYGTVCHMTNEMHELVSTGRCTHKGQHYTCDIAMSNNAIDIWEIRNEQRTELFSPINTTALNGLQRVEVPNITTNVLDMMANHAIVRKRIIYVDKRLYRSLALRAMRENTTYEDLLVAARTQLHGVIYSPGSVVWKHITDSSILMDTAMVALWKGKRLLKNAGEATRLLADSLSEDLARSNMGRVKEIILGMSGHLTKLLGLNLNWNQMSHILENSDVNFLRDIGREMEKWSVRVDEYSREILGVAKSIRPDSKVTSAITGFAVSNLLNVRSLARSISPTALREHNPAKRKIIQRQVNAREKLIQALMNNADWWVKRPEIEGRLQKMVNNLNSGGAGTGKIADSNVMKHALVEALHKRDLAGIETVLNNSEGKSEKDEKGTIELVKKLQTYRGTMNEFNIGAADAITAERLESLLTTTSTRLTKEAASLAAEVAKPAEDMEPRDYSTLWNVMEATLAKMGIEFKRTFTMTKSINNARVCIVATGSRGDIRPAHNLAKQMSLDGATVSLLCPYGSVTESDVYDIQYVYGNYDVDAELHKWHKLMQWTPESIDIIMRDDLDNNWLRQLETEKLQTGYDLVVGSPVTPMGLCLAYIYNTTYVDFCPMPLRNVQGSMFERVYARLLSREYVLLHEKAINAMCQSMLGQKADIKALLLMHRPYAFAADQVLNTPTSGETMISTVGYWGGKTIDEKYDKIDFVSDNLKTVITMGSMMDESVAAALLADLDPNSTVVLAKQNSPLNKEAAKRNIKTYDGDYNLSQLPNHITVLHHGGAGTTAELSRAKCWQVVYPVAFDQKHWAQSVEERGLGRWIRDKKNVNEEDVRYREPADITIRTNVKEMATQFTQLLSRATGAAWSWAAEASIFATVDTGRKHNWARLIGGMTSKIIPEDNLGVYFDTNPRDLETVFDPAGTVEGERGTCAVRAVNHVIGDNDSAIRLRLSKMRLTLEQVDNQGMTMEEIISYTLDCKRNIVICTENSCRAVLAHPAWEIVYVWWQDAGHAVLINPVNLPSKRLAVANTNNKPNELEKVTCTNTGKQAAGWPVTLDEVRHDDICVPYEQLLNEVSRVVQNANTTQPEGSTTARWNGHSRRIVADRIKSNFASARRKTHTWIYSTNLRKWAKGVSAMVENQPGKLVAFHDANGSFLLGVCIGMDDDGWTYYVTDPKLLDGMNPTGLVLDSNTYLTGGSQRNVQKVPIRAVNSQTNTLLNTHLPICSNYDNREADKVLLGYHDGVPHHWNKNLFHTYSPDDFLFTSELVENRELANRLANNRGPLKTAIYGDEILSNLVVKWPTFSEEYMAQCRDRWHFSNDTFGVSWKEEDTTEVLVEAINTLVIPVDDEAGYYKLDIPSNLHNTYPANKFEECMQNWNASAMSITALQPSSPWFLKPCRNNSGELCIGTWYYEVMTTDSTTPGEEGASTSDSQATHWYTIDAEYITADTLMPETEDDTAVIVTRSNRPDLIHHTSLTAEELWDEKKDQITSGENGYCFIKCTSMEEVLAWMNADFMPYDSEHNYDCGPPRQENLSGWISRNGLVKYKDNLWSDWSTEMSKEVWSMILKQSPPEGYCNLRDVRAALGMTALEAHEAIQIMKCEIFNFKSRATTYNRNKPITIEGNTIVGLTCYAECAQLIIVKNPELATVTLDPDEPVGEITYRRDEVNKYRNGNGTKMHHLTDQVYLDRSDQIKVNREKWPTVVKTILDNFLKPNHTHIIVTANAEWNPIEQKAYKDDKHRATTLFINLTHDCTYQQGWINVNIPATQNRNVKFLRQARTMFFYVPEFQPNVQVTVVGGREDYTEYAKGAMPDFPKTRGVLKHNAHSIGGQLYMNNCTGMMGTLNHAKLYWEQDMELTSHIYGTDEWLAGEVASNYTRMARVTSNNVKPVQKAVSYVEQPPLGLAPNWLDKGEKEAAKKILKFYGLGSGDDEKAVAMRILRNHKPGVIGDRVNLEEAKLTLADLACASDHTVTNADSDTFELTLEGLVRSTELEYASITGVPSYNTKPLFIMPGCRMNNILGFTTISVNSGGGERSMMLNIKNKNLTENVVHALAATSYQTAVVQWSNKWSNPLENIRRTSIKAWPTITPVYEGGELMGIIYNNPDPSEFKMDKIKTATPFKCLNHLGELRYTRNHRYDEPLKSTWPRTYHLTSNINPDNKDWHWSEIELNNLVGNASKLMALPIATNDQIADGKALGHPTTVSIINELTSAISHLPQGPLREKAVSEMKIWDDMSPDIRWYKITVDKQQGNDWITNTAITRSYKTENSTVFYHKLRGTFLMQRTAKSMQYEQEDRVVENDGLWFDDVGVQDTGLIETDKHGIIQGYKATPVINKYGGKPEQEEQELMPWAVAIPEEEARGIASHLSSRFIMHRDLIMGPEQERLDKVDDPAMLNGLLKAYSRRVKPGQILLTWGPKTVDQKTAIYHGSLMLSTNRYGEDNQHTRDALREGPEHDRVSIVATETELIERLQEIEKTMLAKQITEKTVLLQDLPLAEFLTNQLHDYELGAGVSTGNPNAKMAYMPLTEPGFSSIGEGEEKPSREIVEDDVIALYENNDLSDLVRIQAPLNKGEGKGFVGTAMPINVITSRKTALTEYPIKSRPVLTQLAYSTENAVFNTLGSQVTYRKHPIDPKHEINMFVKTYGGPNTTELMNRWAKEPLYFDIERIQEWLAGRTGVPEIDRELQSILSEGLFNQPINKLNVHNKLESLLKSAPITNFAQQQVRIIVWQQKGYAALFSHVFLQAKARLKEFLGPKFLYADGLTPQQLSTRCRLEKCNGFLEDDLTKQDRQTDEDTINCEMRVYTHVLGVHQDVVQLWRAAHDHWYFKGSGIKGRLNMMRHTGQATTAIGNVLVNLLVHRRMADELGEALKLMLVLGDDNLTLSDKPINPRKLRVQIRDLWNMESKAEYSEKSGVFLRMLACKDTNNRVQLGPDYVRLRNRFEFTNGQHMISDETIEARALSYACMLGPLPGVLAAIETCQHKVEPVEWYDPIPQVEAVGDYYFKEAPAELRGGMVLNEINLLNKMMSERRTYEYEFHHYTTVEKQHK